MLTMSTPPATSIVDSEADPQAQAVLLADVDKVYGKGDGAVAALCDVSLELRPRILHRRHGPVWLGQEHVPARRRGARRADRGLGTARRRRSRRAHRRPR